MLKRVEKLTAGRGGASSRPPSCCRLARPSTKPMPLLRERGLPTRRVEAWHYTDLRNAIKAFPPLAESASQGS